MSNEYIMSTIHDFSKMMNISTAALINAVDPKNREDRYLADKISQTMGFVNFTCMLLEAAPDLLYELQMQTSDGRFAIVMRLPDNSPKPVDSRLFRCVTSTIRNGGPKTEILKKKSSRWFVENKTDIRNWAILHDEKKTQQTVA